MRDLEHTYSDTISAKKIAILGPFPPPLGGVSVHVKRVMHKLQQQQNTVIVFDTCVEYRYRFFLLYCLRLLWFLFLYRPEIIYFHTLYLSNGLQELVLLLHYKKFLPCKLRIIEHDCRYLYKQSDDYKKKLHMALANVDEVIAIGYLTDKSFRDNGITMPAKYSVQAAFLPPAINDEAAILATYPSILFTFIQSHTLLLCVNAFQLSLLDGNDLYGFDTAIDAMVTLVLNYPGAGCIFVLGQIGDQAYYEQLQKKISFHGLHNHVYFLIGQKELWPLIKRCSIFIRPTRSDAASVSVQEALYFKIPVIASDVCPRPSGVVLFRTGDGKGLGDKIVEVVTTKLQF